MKITCRRCSMWVLIGDLLWPLCWMKLVSDWPDWIGLDCHQRIVFISGICHHFVYVCVNRCGRQLCGIASCGVNGLAVLLLRIQEKRAASIRCEAMRFNRRRGPSAVHLLPGERRYSTFWLLPHVEGFSLGSSRVKCVRVGCSYCGISEEKRKRTETQLWSSARGIN